MSNKQLENNYDAEGIVVYVGLPESFGKMGQHHKRILALKMYEGNFETSVPFEFINRSMSQLDNISVGDRVIVNFQLSGNFQEREGGIRWFSRLKGRGAQKI